MSYTELSSKWVKIRKPRRCDGCLESFGVGSSLHYKAYKWEGEFTTDYLCMPCLDYIDTMDPSDREDGFSPGDIGEWRKQE